MKRLKKSSTIKPPEVSLEAEGEVYRKRHESFYYIFENVATGVETSFSHIEEDGYEKIAQFEKGKTIIYD